MNMATKLTKAFAEFVGERGFEIANEYCLIGTRIILDEVFTERIEE